LVRAVTESPTGRFAGRVAIVTGSGGGVGRATAARLAAEGAAVAVADIRLEAAEQTVAGIQAVGGRAIAVATDVSSESAVKSLVDVTVQTYGRLDILHNNAAALTADIYGRDLDLVDLDVDVWNTMMEVNARGAMLGCKYAVPHLRAAGGGSIVNTVSVAGLHGGDDHAAYGSSKATVMALTKYVASMYGRYSIRCNAVAPGLVLSETARAALSQPQLDEFAIERSLPWASDPEDIAAAVLWLSSDEARCITGQTIVIDSGIMARRPRDILADWSRHMAKTAEAGSG
jgi:NAD(P)-dependent dehydrogenase (short-subunit alcohol dehydrogenase family)